MKVLECDKCHRLFRSTEKPRIFMVAPADGCPSLPKSEWNFCPICSELLCGFINEALAKEKEPEQVKA